jgi:peptidoglycan hydrolase-like protein with peptidoglycan-binding domain
MRTLLPILLLVSLASLRADDTVAKAQQSLKDQGFYYGEVSGEKNTDTSAAIRRYQIRNGLEVTGDLNDETLKSLRNSASAAAAKPAVTPMPAPSSTDNGTSDLRQEPPRDASTTNPAPPQPYSGSPPNQPAPPPNSGGVVPSGGGLFAGTPYETAPPEVQRKVLKDAKKVLGRLGLYRGAVDGSFGPDLEFSLRAYQSRVGLQTSGRLDLETLAALELLPGAPGPGFMRPRRGLPPPPVRGEWIRP